MKRLIIFIMVLGWACNSSIDPQPEAVGWDYYPLETGRFLEYDVVEIDAGSNDSTKYQLRTVLTEEFDNLGGTESFIMFRYTRENPMSEWIFQSSWTVRRDFGRLVVYEENIPYLKISFPVAQGREWDGNSLNTSTGDTYEIIAEGDAVLLPDGLQTTGLTVLQEDLFDLIIGEEDFRQEQYAEGIGLISRDIRQVQYLDGVSDTIAESGLIYYERLYRYGVED